MAENTYTYLLSNVRKLLLTLKKIIFSGDDSNISAVSSTQRTSEFVRILAVFDKFTYRDLCIR